MEMLWEEYYNLPASFRASDTSRKEIDAVVELDDGLLFVEVKWGELRKREAEKILEGLKKKAGSFDVKSKGFLLIAKGIEDKGRGMMDLEDLERFVRG